MKKRNPKSGFIDNTNLILATDFYQITMSAAYYQDNLENKRNEKDDIAIFDLFVRKFPKNRNYLIFAGLEQVIHYLQSARFSQKTIQFLRNKKIFENVDPSFFNDYLPNFKFRLEVFAMKEGSFFFPNEPVIKIQGPMIHAQLAETYLLNIINYQTLIASKASRIKNIAHDKILLEFGTRRAHSPLAGVYAARASYIAGFNGTSNVVSDFELGINSSGTMAHSFVQRFDNEMESFEKYFNIYGEDSILLIDTYDTEKAARKITKFKNRIKAVRIDSGNLIEHSKQVRKILDENGCERVQIVASSDLNEYKIKEILDNNAPIDAFGVGTELATSRDDPTMAGVYKLIEYNGKPRIKTSEKKLIIPGNKQIYRIYDKKGIFKEDFITLINDTPPPNSEPLLLPIMENGELIYDLPSLPEIQDFCLNNIRKLPDGYKILEENHINILRFSKKLTDLTNLIIKQHTN